MGGRGLVYTAEGEDTPRNGGGSYNNCTILCRDPHPLKTYESKI